jgi:hypothetical protein
MLVVCEVNAAVVPGVAVTTGGFEASKGCLGGVAGSVLEKRSG